MPALQSNPSDSAGQAAKPVILTRYRFHQTSTGSANPVRRFVAPHAGVAVEESSRPWSAESPAGQATWPEPTDTLDLVRANRPSLFSEADRIQFLAAPTDPAAPLAAEFELDGCELGWRPGRAVLCGNPKTARDMLPGLLEFAYLEAELRRMEQEFLPIEAGAQADVKFTYAVRGEDHAQWPRLKTTMETLAGLRLRFAKLEPTLDSPPGTLTRTARKTFARLATRARVAERLEGLTNRLEACEDLYEGAVDRAADFRWYRQGNRLEIAIVALLLIEAILMAAELMREH